MESANHVNPPSKKLLKEVREQLSLSQEKMAKRLGIERANLSKWENGQKYPDWFFKALRLHTLLKEAGLSLDDLTTPDDPQGDRL